MFMSSFLNYFFLIQDVEEEEEADEHPVRQNIIRETLEVGVRRMNLNAAAAVKETGGGAGSSGSRRELENRIKKVDRLQSQIEQSFRTVKKEFLKGTSQGKNSALLLALLRYVFGPLGSRSVSQTYGSGSFYQAKIVRKTSIPTVFLCLLCDFLSLKTDVNVPSKCKNQKN
jgi:hypothetical protein